MSTTTAPTPYQQAPRSQLTFGGILRSEWIKLRSLRSTFWCYLLILLLDIGLAALISRLVGADDTAGGVAPSDSMATATTAITLGLNFTVLIVAVLGALTITGEYSTGMIRSTFTADPRRLGALFGKALVFGVVTFVVVFVSLILAALVAAPLLKSSSGIALQWSDGTFWLALAGGAGYLTLAGLLSFFIGAILRSTAGGIAASIGLLFVVNIVLGILVAVTDSAWAQNIATFLPSVAGGLMSSYDAGTAGVKGGVVTLDKSLGLLVMVGWVVIPGVLATLLVKRRDA